MQVHATGRSNNLDGRALEVVPDLPLVMATYG